MGKELKIGAILGLFVVGLGSWFYYSRSSGDEARPIPLNRSLSATTDREPDTAKPPGADRTAGKQPQRKATVPRRSASKAARKTPPTANRQVAAKPPTPKARRNAKKPPQAVTRRKPSATRPQPTGARKTAKKPTLAARKGQTPKDSGALLASTAIPKDDTPKSGGVRPVNRGVANNTVPRAPTHERSAGTLKPAKQPVNAKPVAKYAVVSGDSFARIAQKKYGSQKHTSFLIEANPQVKNPDRLKIGQVLNVPPLPDTNDAAGVAANRTTRARNANERTYVVKENDNFFDIALAQLGDGGRWPEIYERNKDQIGTDPMNLKPGQVLRLPSK